MWGFWLVFFGLGLVWLVGLEFVFLVVLGLVFFFFICLSFLIKRKKTIQTTLILFKSKLNTRKGEVLINSSGSLWQHIGFTKSVLAAS